MVFQLITKQLIPCAPQHDHVILYNIIYTIRFNWFCRRKISKIIMKVHAFKLYKINVLFFNPF